MLTLKQYIYHASEKHTAIGHFNMSNIETMWSIFRVAKKLDLPVIIGTSEGERKFIGVKQCVALIQSLRKEFDHPVFLNADHTYSFESVKEAIDAGYDSVIFDGAKYDMRENIILTRQCVEYARSANPNVLVEGELGYIGQSSTVYDILPDGVVTSTSPEDAVHFVKETGVDFLAPAVGNIHGMLRSGQEPALDIELIKKIRDSVGIPLVLHGGSGTSDREFLRAVYAGMAVVHISTELRVAYRSQLERTFKEKPNEYAPYRLMENSIFGMEKVVEERLKIFSTHSAS